MRPRLLTVLSGVVLPVSGCGLVPGDSDGTPRERVGQAVAQAREAIGAEVQRAVEQAEQRQVEDTGSIDRGTDPGVHAIRTDTSTAQGGPRCGSEQAPARQECVVQR